jgi:hypothetical protein
MASDRSVLIINDEGLNRLRARVDALGAGVDKAGYRAARTLARVLPTRAADLIAEKVLNLPASKIRDHLSLVTSGDNVILRGVDKRLPLQDFSGTRWGGPSTPGAVIKKWRDSPAETYSAARAAASDVLVGGAFALKGRGVSGGIYNRIFKTHPSGRQVVTRRLGPSFSRAVLEKKHGDIYPELIETGREALRAELFRLLAEKG